MGLLSPGGCIFEPIAPEAAKWVSGGVVKRYYIYIYVHGALLLELYRGDVGTCRICGVKNEGF